MYYITTHRSAHKTCIKHHLLNLLAHYIHNTQANRQKKIQNHRINGGNRRLLLENRQTSGGRCYTPTFGPVWPTNRRNRPNFASIWPNRRNGERTREDEDRTGENGRENVGGSSDGENKTGMTLMGLMGLFLYFSEI